ncbi:reverse transcriptase domain-containing protein [Tanacetum coccineum]
MADKFGTDGQMLQAPSRVYEDAIVIPPINANNFELKQPLINLVQSNKFTGRQDPHNHLRFFNKVTSTFRHPEVPNTSIKLLLFPFSLDGEARDWLDKEPPRSILTWEQNFSEKTRRIGEKFLIPCALQELDRTSALADSGASINLLPHSIYKKLGLKFNSTRNGTELANCSINPPRWA